MAASGLVAARGSASSAGQVAAYGTRVEDLDGRDPRADDVALETSPYDLDLRQLRHERPPQASAGAAAVSSR